MRNKKQKINVSSSGSNPLWKALGFEDEIGYRGYMEYNKEESIYIGLDEFESILREDSILAYKTHNKVINIIRS